MILIDALEHASYGVRDIVDTRATQSLLAQQVNSLVELTAPVFEVGCWAAHLGDEALEQLGNGVAAPGGGHADPNTVDAVEREGPWGELVMLGLAGQDGQHLAC